MALFVVVGVTNLAAMVVLAAVVLAEKLWVHGELSPGPSAWPPWPWPSPCSGCRRWHQDSTRPAR
jgi:hypothetical protein